MTEINNVVDILYLTADNVRFCDEGGYISMKFTTAEVATAPTAASAAETVAETVEAPAAEAAAAAPKEYERVHLARCFPFDDGDRYISVSDAELKEIGIIRSLDELDAESRDACTTELHRKYFTRRILSVEKIKDRYGYTYWNVITDSGAVEFSLHDTYRSIRKITPDHLLINDIDGNIFEIESVDKLPRKSYRMIELYL